MLPAGDVLPIGQILTSPDLVAATVALLAALWCVEGCLLLTALARDDAAEAGELYL